MQVDWTVGQVIKAVDDANWATTPWSSIQVTMLPSCTVESDKDKPHHLSTENRAKIFRG